MIVRDVEKWFSLNLDLQSRMIYMGSMHTHEDGSEGGVDHNMTECFIKGMHVLESKNKKPITVIMNNPGGDWYHGMAIYDAIKYSNCHITIKVYGYAMSMGSVILQAADERIMMPNSRFMIHYGTDGIAGHTKIFEKWADESKRNNWIMENIYLDSMLEKEEKEGGGHLAGAISRILAKQKTFEIKSILPEAKITFSEKAEEKREQLRLHLANLLNYDTILSPEETIDLGFADKIFERLP